MYQTSEYIASTKMLMFDANSIAAESDSSGKILQITALAAVLTIGAPSLSSNAQSVSIQNIPKISAISQLPFSTKKNDQIDDALCINSTLPNLNFIRSLPNVGIEEQLIEKIQQLKYLNEDWDGYGGIAPTSDIVNKSNRLIKSFSKKYVDLIDVEEGVFANNHGTITIEWRPNEDNVVSVELGRSSHNYYAIIQGETYKSDTKNEMGNEFKEEIESLLSKMLSFYYK